MSQAAQTGSPQGGETKEALTLDPRGKGLVTSTPTEKPGAGGGSPSAQQAPGTSETPVPEAEAKPGEGEKPADKKEPEKKDDKFSERFAALARREAQIVRQDQAVKVKETALATREADLTAREAKLADLEKLRAEAPTNPLKALEYFGLTYDKITEFVLNDGKPTADVIAKKMVDDEFSRRDRERADKEREDAEKATKAAEAEHAEVLAEFRKGVTDFVTKNAEKYELTRLQDEENGSGTELILAIIEENFQATSKAGQPRVMSKEEAADLAEKYFESLVEKATATKKIQAKVQPQPQGDKKPSDPAKPRTLDNSLTPSGATPPEDRRPLSREERIARAMKVAV